MIEDWLHKPGVLNLLFTFLSICLKTSKSFLFQHEARALGSCLIPPHTYTQQADIKVVYTGWINWCRFIAHVHELQGFILPPFLLFSTRRQASYTNYLQLSLSNNLWRSTTQLKWSQRNWYFSGIQYLSSNTRTL